MRKRVFRAVVGALAMFALVVGCSAADICSGDVGPETLRVDASAFDDGESIIEVCVRFHNEPHCAPEGTPEVSITFHNDYPKVMNYFVSLRQDAAFTFPEGGGGTHRMECRATTTNIVLRPQPR